MSSHLKRSIWAATLERYPSSFKNSPEDRERSSSLRGRPARPFLRRPSTNGVTLQTCGATISNLAAVAIPEVPRVTTRTRSRSSDSLIPWSRPRRHSFSGSHAPGIGARHQALPLFTAPRGHQRGMGISNSLIAMDVPDLSLRCTFSPQLLLKDSPKPLLLKDSPNTTAASTCSMCKYTIYNLDCGHPAEDHVDPRDCPHFNATLVECDRENPANRNRVSVKTEDRKGICNKCRRKQREIEELEAMSRDEKRAKEQSQAEAKQRENDAAAHEERLLKESREEWERLQRKKEQEDLEFMLQKSREQAEADRVQKEQEDLAAALKASCVVERSDRNVTVDRKTHLPSPPATPIRSSRSVRPPPPEEPPAPVDFSKPAGQLSGEYGHYTIGGRRAPIHDSQREKAAKYGQSSPATPKTPVAPSVRLGGAVQPNSPSPRAMSSMSPASMPGGDFRAGLRRTATTGPRKSMPAQVEVDDGAELRYHLARRRTLEPRTSVEDLMAKFEITPSESASNRQSRASSPTGSNLSRASSARNDSVYGEIDLPLKTVHDQRRRGSRKD